MDKKIAIGLLILQVVLVVLTSLFYVHDIGIFLVLGVEIYSGVLIVLFASNAHKNEKGWVLFFIFSFLTLIFGTILYFFLFWITGGRGGPEFGYGIIFSAVALFLCYLITTLDLAIKNYNENRVLSVICFILSVITLIFFIVIRKYILLHGLA